MRKRTVFISYSSKDKGFAEKLAADLRASGARVWFAPREIKVGDSITQKINDGIHDNDYLAVVLSPDSVASPWVRKELNAAMMKELNRRSVVVLPILYRDCEIPPLIADKRYADFRKSYESGFSEILRVLAPEEEGARPRPRLPVRRPQAKPRRPLREKLLTALRDPMWQMIGVIVAVITLAWGIYTFYADGDGPPTPSQSPTQTTTTVAMIPTATNMSFPHTATLTSTPSPMPVPPEPTDTPTSTPTATSTPMVSEADLGLSQVDAVDPVTEGDDVTYTVTVTNNGPDAALNVVLTDDLPGGVAFVSATPAEGSCSKAGGVVTCNLGEVASGGSVGVEVVVTTKAAGVITNSASVTSDTADPNPADNSASQETTVTPTPSAPSGMVYVPDGEFTMGSSDAELAYALQLCNKYYDGDCDKVQIGFEDEQPQHTVYLDAFYIDKTEVTNAQYRRCVEAGACSQPQDTGWYNDSNRAEHPVVWVSWHQANDYCRWAEKRLPTEAEWEKAARGTDGRIYPWGNKFDKSKLMNFCDKNCPEGWKDASADDGYVETAPVGSYPAGASPYGALDMAGNVDEWVADWYDSGYYSQTPTPNPPGPAPGEKRVLRGGSWYYIPYSVRCAYRGADPPVGRGKAWGFRCARDSQ